MAGRRERRARAAGKKIPPERRWPFEKKGGRRVHMKTGVMETIEIRRWRVIEERMKGQSFREIGRVLGVSKDTAYDDFIAEMAHAADAKAAARAELLALEVARLDAIQAAWWDAALPTGRRRRDHKAAVIVLNCIEKRARLLALFPTTDNAGSDGYRSASQPLIDVTPESTLQARIDETRKRLAAATPVIDWAAFDAAAQTAAQTPDTTKGGAHG